MINIELEQEILNYVQKLKNGIVWNKLPKEYEDYLLQRYNDNSSNELKLYLKESYLRIKNNINEIPKCPICGKSSKFYGSKYMIYAPSCGNKICSSKLRHINSRKTKLERYGDENYSNREKQKQTKLERYGDENYSNREQAVKNTDYKKRQEKIKQTKNTFKEKYGVEYSWNIPGVSDKSKQTKLERYGDENYTNREKSKQTCLERYGVDNVFKIKEVQEKYRQTCLNNWGVDHNWKIPEEHDSTHTPEALEKKKLTSLKNWGTEYPHQCKKIIERVNNTKRKNNTFNTSKIEELSYILLKEKYEDVIRQYKSELYPFVCDFYIPSLNLYIECNYHWTHGDHPYNENNKEDQILLEKWKTKNTKYYKGAIYTWTIRDVNKRNIAKQNNLNYIEFWNNNELKKWIEN